MVKLPLSFIILITDYLGKIFKTITKIVIEIITFFVGIILFTIYHFLLAIRWGLNKIRFWIKGPRLYYFAYNPAQHFSSRLSCNDIRKRKIGNRRARNARQLTRKINKKKKKT